MSKMNKYQEIVSSISRKILSGEYPPGMKLPGQFALAEEYKVSAITSNRALNELRNIGFLERRERSGSYVVDEPPLFLELLIVFEGTFSRKDLSRQNFWLADYWQGASFQAERKNIKVQLIFASDSDFEAKLFNDPIGKAVIFLGFEPKKLIKRLEKIKVPCVVAALKAESAKYSVLENRFDATVEILKKMRQDGCSKISMIADLEQPNHQFAAQGYQHAIESLGLEDLGIHSTTPETLGSTLPELLEKSGGLPDGLVIMGGKLPFMALPYLMKLPKHPALGFFCENSTVAGLRQFAYVASYSQYEVGELAFKMLCQLSANQVLEPGAYYPKFEILEPPKSQNL